jgi:hypothetical protein
MDAAFAAAAQSQNACDAERQRRKTDTKKPSRHVTIALNHLNKRRESLLEKRAGLTKEIEELDAAILALG